MFSDEHFNLPTISTQFSYIDFSFTASGVGVKLRKLGLWRGLKSPKPYIITMLLFCGAAGTSPRSLLIQTYTHSVMLIYYIF